MDPGRRAHYADFYAADHRHPVAVIWGNCQAESLRVLVAGSPSFPLLTVRVPPVHELTADDMAPLQALLPHVAVLLSQPVRSGYRSLPIGTDDLTPSLASGAQVIRWPVIRYHGLCPFSAIVRHPADPSLDPPVVPYHDLRTLARAAGRSRRSTPSPAALRAVADASVAELARREHLGTDVGVSDLLVPLGADASHTLNHPGNGILIALARRLQRWLHLPADAEDPGRELLGRLRAPLEPEVVDALDLDTPARRDWDVEGVVIPADELEDTQLAWYRDNEVCVEAGLRRHGERLALLGL